MKKRDWLISMRKEMGYTQEELGHQVGTGGSIISEIERGNRSPSGKLAYRLSNLFDFDMARFFDDDIA